MGQISNWLKSRNSQSSINQPIENYQKLSKNWSQKLRSLDLVIIGTPEYDHSIPAALMNALAWVSYGVYPLLNKPVMITGASYGTLGSSCAQPDEATSNSSTLLNSRPLSCQDEFLLSHSLQALMPMGSSLI